MIDDANCPSFTTNGNSTSDTPTLEQLHETAQKFRAMIEQNLVDTGMALMSHGIQLIPMEHLSNSQFGVSVAMYEAVKRHCKKHGADDLLFGK